MHLALMDQGIGITTWGQRDGQQVWRARDRHGRVAEFVAPRDAPIAVLSRRARHALDSLHDERYARPSPSW